MIKIRDYEEHELVTFDIFTKSRNLTMDDIVNKCDANIVKKAKEMYSSIDNIIVEGLELAVTSSLCGLRHTDESFAMHLGVFKHQIKSYYYMWTSLPNDPLPFDIGHTYHINYGLCFGDHWLQADERTIKSYPKKLYYYLENAIAGQYSITFYNGVEMEFIIDENGNFAEGKRLKLSKSRLGTRSITPTIVLMYIFFRLGIKAKDGKIAYKLMRNVSKIVNEIIDGERKNG